MMVANLFLIVLLGTFGSSIAFKTGAPLDACSSLLPGHGSDPQQGPSPFVLHAKSIGGYKVQVNITVTSGENFKGFILQARSASDNEKFIVGKFTTDDKTKSISCWNQEKSTLTHADNEPKSLIVTEWTGIDDGDIIFRATVVKNYDTFWMNIDSNPVTVSANEPVETNDVSDYEGCFKSKGCIGFPAKCVEKESCKGLLTFKGNDDGGIKFSLHGLLESSEYIALGISQDNLMGDDFVTECIESDSGEVKLRKSWNNLKHNELTEDLSTPYNASFVKGITKCFWNEPNVLKFNDRTYDLADKAYILLAYGKVENETIQYHYDSKFRTKKPVNLFSVEPVDLEQGRGTGSSSDERVGSKSKTEDTKGTNSCSRLNFSLLWLALFGAFNAGRRNVRILV